jgi:hypothetical protein
MPNGSMQHYITIKYSAQGMLTNCILPMSTMQHITVHAERLQLVRAIIATGQQHQMQLPPRLVLVPGSSTVINHTQLWPTAGNAVVSNSEYSVQASSQR